MSGDLWFDWDEDKRQVNRNRHGAPTKRNMTAMSKKLIAPTRAEDVAITAATADGPDSWEMDEAGFAKAKRGRPFAADPKLPVTLRLDSDVVRHFRATGKGWQTRINNILRNEIGL